MEKGIKFEEDSINELFGSEAAEDEEPDRLEQYFFKGPTFDNIMSRSKVKILVGHKGVGKSAIMKIAEKELNAHGNLSINIRIDDLKEIHHEHLAMDVAISNWKTDLRKIIVDKVIEFGPDESKWHKKLTSRFYPVMTEILKAIKIESDEIKRRVSNFVKDESKFIYIFMDDLDRGWSGTKDELSRVAALINAIRDISNDNKEIKFRIALRTDVYFLLRRSDESQDKIENFIEWVSYSNHDILIMLAIRVATYLDITHYIEEIKKMKQQSLAQYLDRVMTARFQGGGKWQNVPMYRVLMTLIRKRPRDLVKLCTAAAYEAQKNKHDKIESSDFSSVFTNYSNGRLNDIEIEYKSEMPNIHDFLMNMKPSRLELRGGRGYIYTTPELKAKINNIIQRVPIKIAGRTPEATDIINFLYKINFITARKELEGGHIERKYYEEKNYLISKHYDKGYEWEIHPAFRWAIGNFDNNDVFREVDLSM